MDSISTAASSPGLQRVVKTHDLEAAVDGGFGPDDGVGIERGDALGEDERLLHVGPGRHDPVDEPNPFGPLRAQLVVAAEQQLLGELRSDEPGHHHVDDDRAELELGLSEAAPFLGDGDVARHRELAPAGQAVAVDRGDCGLWKVPEPEEEVEVAREARAPRLRVPGGRHRIVLQVVAGAEGAPGPVHHHRPEVVVLGDRIEHRIDLVHHPRGDGVEPIRPVEGEQPDPATRLEADGLEVAYEAHRGHCPTADRAVAVTRFRGRSSAHEFVTVPQILIGSRYCSECRALRHSLPSFEIPLVIQSIADLASIRVWLRAGYRRFRGWLREGAKSG